MAIATVPFEQVRPFLTEERCRVLLRLDEANPAGVTVDVDGATVGMQGQFWYRGEYSFEPAGYGTAITYRITNVSTSPDAVIRLWQRKVLNQLQSTVDQYAVDLPDLIRRTSA